MNKLTKLTLGLVAAGSLAAVGIAGPNGERKAVTKANDLMAKERKTTVLWPAADIKWTENAESKGLWAATLWGDSTKGAYGALQKWAAGTVVPMHTHTYASKGVVISGTLNVTIDGKSTDLGAGSYVSIPGGQPHISKCNPGADCVFLLEQPGAGDLKLVETK